jgi:DNA-binding transcriptional MerR regulator
MRIGDIAAAAGVAPSLVRYYEMKGIIPPPVRSSGARAYEPSALERLREALVARRLGFSLTEIKAALAAERSWSEIAATRITAIDDEIRRLRVKRALLRHAAHAGALTPGRYARLLGKIGA